jgi:hypothetical protein
MNETRKAIIGLIEPYMDKTLSEWCFIESKLTWSIWKIINLSWWNNWDLIITLEMWNYAWKQDLYDRCDIIWHYDITAFLKYIDSKWYEYSKEYNEQKFIVETNIRIDSEWNTIWDFIWSFEIKPLHLYDANEEENLLKLLQSLNNL